MNRILTLVITLLVLGIAISRTNDILIALSPYQIAGAATSPAPAAVEEIPVEESELGGRVALSP